MLQKNQEIYLTIDAVSSDGNGIGRHDGMAVFVPFSVVGDKLLARIVKVAKRYAYGIILDILSPSPHRIDADCPSFGKCGGCSFRHISYDEELRLKKGFVSDSLTRIGRLLANTNDTIPSPILTGYRNKVQLPVFQTFSGELRTGFYAARSHRAVPFDDGCHLEPAELSKITNTICSTLTKQGVFAYDEKSHSGLLRHIVLRKSSVDGSALLALVVNGTTLPDETAFIGEVTRLHPAIRSIVLNRNQKDTNVILGKNTRILFGDGFLNERLAGVDLRLSLPSFFQINHAAAELLYAKIREYAASGPNDTLLDLYCGVGSIGLSLAKQCGKLIGVEIVPEAVEDAKHNAALNEIDNADFICADAKETAVRLSHSGIRPNCIIVDPPRKGCDPETLKAMMEMSPARIVMVSCNPATLARDLMRLTALGYSVEDVTPVDMFPRTNHVESVALLHRKNDESCHF